MPAQTELGVELELNEVQSETAEQHVRKESEDPPLASPAALSPPPIETSSDVRPSTLDIGVEVDNPPPAASAPLPGSSESPNLDSRSPADSRSPGLLNRAKSGMHVIREKSRSRMHNGISMLKKSASIAAGHLPPSDDVSKNQRSVDLPPPYKPDIDLPPAYPDDAPPPYSDGQLPSPAQPEPIAPSPVAFNPDPPAAVSQQLQPEQLPPPMISAEVDGSERIKGAMVVLCAVLICCGLLAAWVCWLAIPLHWVTTGRHEVKNNWDQVNCTVVFQSCYKQCSGCGCPDSCCTSALDCFRSNYFMSQTCVWLSNSKYSQNSDFTAFVDINDAIAPAWRPEASMAGVVTAVALGLGALRWGRLRALWALVLLASVLVAHGKTTNSNNDCNCDERYVIDMTVEYSGGAGEAATVLAQSLACSDGDDRAFCQDEEFKHRDKSCRSIEDMEKKSYCNIDNLNRKGKTRTCYLNPDDPSELEIAGSKPWGGGVLAAIITWAIFTACCCCAGLASVGG